MVCAICGAPIRWVVETNWVDLDGDQLSYSPGLHDHGPHEHASDVPEVDAVDAFAGTQEALDRQLEDR